MRESGLANAPDELKQVTLAMCLFNQVSKEIDLMNKLSLILDQLETMPAADEDKLQQELALLKKKNQEIADLRRELADPHRHPSLTHSERIKIERNLVNLLENKDYKKLDDTVNAFLLIERDQVRAELDKRDERSDIQAVIAFIASNSPDKADMAINISEAMRAKGQPLPSLEGLMGTVPIAQSSGIDDSFKDLWMKIKSE